MPGSLLRRVLLFAFVAAVLTACTSAELTFGGPLDVQVSSNSPVAVSDSLRLEYDVSGRSLLGLVVQWGDSQVDTVLFAGAQSAGGRTFHLYDSAGTYDLQATALDQFQGSVSEQLTVTVTP